MHRQVPGGEDGSRQERRVYNSADFLLAEKHVQIMTNITPEELRQAIRLNRSKTYWLKLIAANWYFTLLLIVIIWAEIARLLEGKPILLNTLPILLIPVFFLWLSWFRTRRAIEQAAQQISDIKGTAVLTEHGIDATASSGATSFVPWSAYSAWKEGPDVFTLTIGKTFRVFSKRGLGSGG
jgi:hypothetical protein